MGKGSNVSKTNRARADAAKKAADEGKGGGGSSGIKERAAPLAVVCAICRSGFMAQQTKEQLMTHVDSKREWQCTPTSFWSTFLLRDRGMEAFQGSQLFPQHASTFSCFSHAQYTHPTHTAFIHVVDSKLKFEECFPGWTPIAR